jgi:hypothetical protein
MPILSEQKLSVGEIAKYWSREMKPPTTRQELLDALSKAWWRGEIRGRAPSTRLQLLQSMFRSVGAGADLGIVFVREGDGPPPKGIELPDGVVDIELTELPDGILEVSKRYHIPVPSGDIADWDEQTCEQAFNALAQISSTNSYPDTAFFSSIQLSFEEFDRWRKALGYDEPAFWRDPAASTVMPEARPGDRTTAQISRVQESRAGRKSSFAAPIRRAVFELMDYHGDLSDDDPQWSVQAHVERAVRDKLGEDGPRAISTVREYVRASIAQWRIKKPTADN